MDAEARKTVLRMIPYGLYILTAKSEGGEIGAGAVNWVTQASFKPPLLAVCVRDDSRLHHAVQEAGAFALNVLDKGQRDLAFTFFKHVEADESTIGGQPYHTGETGAPILTNLPGYLECRVVASVHEGDHTVFVGEVVGAGLTRPIEGRPDEQTLWLRDLGPDIFYGG